MDRSRSDRVLEDWDMLSKDAPRPPLPPPSSSSGRWLPAAAVTFAAIVIIAVAAGAIWVSRPGAGGVGQSPTPTGSPPGSPSPTATGSPSASPTASASPEPTDALGPFTCDLPVNRPGTAAGATQADPSAVRVGTHDGYDRIVFEYRGAVLPTLTIETAAPPFRHDPSDLPMTVSGSAFLRIKLDGVAMGYSGTTDFAPGYPALVELARQGDFEGVQSWIAGLTKTSCVRVLQLTGPARLVIDIQH